MKLAYNEILKLLPAHIADDPQFSAAGGSTNPFLNALSRSIPNLLIWARLGRQDPETFLAPLRRLTEGRPGLAPLDTQTLESLAWQFHVDFREAAKNDAQLAGMVLNSIAWHRIKGTPASIYAALDLFGYTGIKIEEHTPGMPWASYQLGFAEIAAIDDLARIVAICREMQPARCRLWRVYVDDYDLRPGVWSGPIPPNTWSNAWWSYYSGTYFPDIPGLDDRGLMVSFGLKRRFQSETFAPGDFLAAIWFSAVRSFLLKRHDHYVWSESFWSDLYPQRHGFFGCGLWSSLLGDQVWESESWENVGEWGQGPWGSLRAHDRKLPQWSMPARDILKSQGVYSDQSDKTGSVWSGLNCNWSWPIAHVFSGGNEIWSKSLWSGEDRRLRLTVIKEQFHNHLRLAAPALAPKFAEGAPAFGNQDLVLEISRARGPAWSGTVWGDVFPSLRGAFRQEILPLQCNEEIYADTSWEDAETWGETPWREFLRYGQEREEGAATIGNLASFAAAASDGRQCAFILGSEQAADRIWSDGWNELAWDGTI